MQVLSGTCMVGVYVVRQTGVQYAEDFPLQCYNVKVDYDKVVYGHYNTQNCHQSGSHAQKCDYTIVLSILFELYTRGKHLKYEMKLSGLKAHFEYTLK